MEGRHQRDRAIRISHIDERVRAIPIRLPTGGLTGYIGIVEGKVPFPGAPPDIIRVTGAGVGIGAKAGLLGFALSDFIR